MKEYRVTYRERPRADLKVIFVEAEDEVSATKIALDHIQRTTGAALAYVNSVRPYERPAGGKVL